MVSARAALGLPIRSPGDADGETGWGTLRLEAVPTLDAPDRAERVRRWNRNDRDRHQARRANHATKR